MSLGGKTDPKIDQMVSEGLSFDTVQRPQSQAEREQPDLYLTTDERYTFRFRLIDDKTHFTQKPDPYEHDEWRTAVSYHFKAWDSKGNEVMSSYSRRAPKRNRLGGGELIRCFEEAIPNIPYGRKARVECCPEMCYHSIGIPGLIPPNEPMKFEIEVMTIDKQF